MKYKQVIVVRKDLEMSPAKLAVQVAHASVNVLFNSGLEKIKDVFEFSETTHKWREEGGYKIVLGVPGLEELGQIKAKAESALLPVWLVVDFGKTELEPNTPTCLGIGPAKATAFRKVTDGLKLY